MHEPVVTARLEVSRREALLSGAALCGLGFAHSAARSADKPRVDPFHDPGYSLIHARADLIKRLGDEARQAQERPRIVNGIHVTGLPASLPELDGAVTNVLKASGIPGAALCIAKNERLVCTRGYGRASLVGSVPVEPTMPATIMSVSKALTATAALTLVRDGKLRLDDLAFKILQEGPLLARGQSVDPRLHKITVRQLMSHTSGLFNVVETLNDPGRFHALAQQGRIQLIHGRIGQNDLVRVGMGHKLLFEPGSKFSYSGQGMQVLGRIVEKVGELRLDRYIQRHICGPLSMHSYYVGSYLKDDQYHRFLKPNREGLYAMCPAIYDKKQKRHRPPSDSSGEYVSWGQADACGWGSMSAIDLLRWVTFFFDLVGPELSKEATDRPWVVNDQGKRVQGGVGLGWFVYGGGDGKAGINHEGAWPGERSFAEHRPGGGSFAVLVNSDDDPQVGKIIDAPRQFLNKLKTFPDGAPDWKDYGFPGIFVRRE